MESDSYFYNSSKEYIDSIDEYLYSTVRDAISKLPRRDTQSEINQHLVWLLTDSGWSFDTVPSGIEDLPQIDLGIIGKTKSQIKMDNNRSLCVTSTTLEADWHADFAKMHNGKLVQIEAQFGKVESMFKDFCGFQIAYSERRLALGIEIVMCEPSKFFAHRKSSVSGMAYFNIARQTLPAIGLDCPIWLVGLRI